MPQPRPAAPTVHQLKVTLRDVKPAVWRRLLVSSDTTLADLHEDLMIAFEWDGGHLHLFEAGRTKYGPPEMLDGFSIGPRVRSENSTTLSAAASRPGAVLTYTYDLGDDWNHRIEVESVTPADPSRIYPTCVAGSGLAPEEDTGEVLPGRFDKAALAELNQILQDGGTAGRDLGASAETAAADPVFAGLFPDFAVTTEGPCTCGQEHDDETAPVLRPHHPVPEAILAEFARGSALVEQALALARWVGTDRTLTPSRLLRPAEALQAFSALGLADPDLPPGRKLRSAKDLPELNGLWSAVLSAELIEIRGTRANPGSGLRVWDEHRESAEQLDSWARLLSGYLRSGSGSPSSWGLQPSQQFVGPSAQLFYSLAHNPIPAALPALVLATADDETDLLPAFWMIGEMATAIELAAQNWIRAGVLKVRDEVAPSPEIAHVKAMLDDLTAGVELDQSPAGVLMAPLVDAVRRSPIVQLTPLGSYGLRRLLLAHGWKIPQIGDHVDAPAAEILDRFQTHDFDEAISEAEIWLGARGEGWRRALEDVLESARSKDLELGPTRRTGLPAILQAVGPKVEPVLDALADDPWLCAIAARVRHDLDLGPEPTLAQQLWLAVDTLCHDQELDEEEVLEGIEATDLIELLQRPGAMQAVSELSHPATRATLLAVARFGGSREVSGQLRRALATSSVPRSIGSGGARRKASGKR